MALWLFRWRTWVKIQSHSLLQLTSSCSKENVGEIVNPAAVVSVMEKSNKRNACWYHYYFVWFSIVYWLSLFADWCQSRKTGNLSGETTQYMCSVWLLMSVQGTEWSKSEVNSGEQTWFEHQFLSNDNFTPQILS